MPLLFYLCCVTALLLALGYVTLIFRLVAVWRAMPVFTAPANHLPETFLSVIIPARNEAAAIGDCLRSLALQDYPPDLYEILVVDDHSTDLTAEIVRQCALPNLRLLSLADYPQLDPTAGFKKQAIAWAIGHARGELIVTTDADCRAPAAWLRTLAVRYEKDNARFLAAPVVFTPGDSLFEDFQALDFLGMMLLTGAGLHTGWYHMSNGANMAYTKAVFEAVGGFRDVQDIASGDDMLLLHKIAAHNHRGIYFVKSPIATVQTNAQPTFRAFLQQRLRWAAKSNRYTDRRVTVVLALVFFLCWSILLSLPAAVLWGWPALAGALLLFLLKSLADYRLLSASAHFFGYPQLLRRFWSAQMMHILYIAGIGLLANVRKQYEWKERRVR